MTSPVTTSTAASTATRTAPTTAASGAVIDSPATRKALVTATENWVRSEMSKNDGSHDYHHIERVRANAMSLARETASATSPTAMAAPVTATTATTTTTTIVKSDDWIIDSDTLLVVELAALLHDVRDWKYAATSPVVTATKPATTTAAAASASSPSGDTAGGNAAIEFLSSQSSVCPMPVALIDRVAYVINHIGTGTPHPSLRQSSEPLLIRCVWVCLCRI